MSALSTHRSPQTTNPKTCFSDYSSRLGLEPVGIALGLSKDRPEGLAKAPTAVAAAVAQYLE